jgi:hypothetical protein
MALQDLIDLVERMDTEGFEIEPGGFWINR